MNELIRESQATPNRQEPHGHATYLLWAAFFLVIAIAFLKLSMVPAKPKIPELDDAAIIRFLDRASQLNIAAWKRFQDRMQATVAASNQNAKERIEKAAAKMSSIDSCKNIVYYLACDKAFGGNRIDAYIKDNLHPVLRAVADDISREFKAHLDAYKSELEVIIMSLGFNLANVKGLGQGVINGINIRDMQNFDLDAPLTNFGINVTGLSAAATFDAYAIYTGLLTRLAGYAINVASRIFAKYVARMATLVVVPWLDGPLPIGDAIAGVGLLWTGWEIANLRPRFKAELIATLTDAHKQSLEQMLVQTTDAAESLNEGFAKFFRNAKGAIVCPQCIVCSGS